MFAILLLLTTTMSARRVLHSLAIESTVAVRAAYSVVPLYLISLECRTTRGLNRRSTAALSPASGTVDTAAKTTS